MARGRVFARTNVLGIGDGPAGPAWDPPPRQRGFQDYPSGPATTGQVYGSRAAPIGSNYGAGGGGFGTSSDVGMVSDSLQRIQQSFQQAHTLDNGDFSMLSTGGLGGPSLGGVSSTTSYQPSFGSNPQLTTGFAPQAAGRRISRAHVSMTADQMPDPKDVKAQRDRELQEQIAIRKAVQEQQARKAREEEDMLERRARAQQEKMQREYEEEVARKKAKDDARAERAEKLKQRIENQWTQPAAANNKQGASKATVADDKDGKPGSGSSMNDMDKEFLGLRPPGNLGLIPPSGAGAGSLLGPSPSTGTNLVAPSSIMGASSVPNLMPPLERGALDLGPEPGSEFLLQRAREMGLSIPGDDLQPSASGSAFDANLGAMPNSSYSDPAANPDFAFLRPSGMAPAGMASSMELSTPMPGMTLADPGFMMSEPPHLFMEPDPLLRGLKTM